MYRSNKRRSLQRLGILLVVLWLSGCSLIPMQINEHYSREAAVIQGSSSRNNTTPMEQAFSCLSSAYREAGTPVVSIAVGDVKDYTGKYSQAEGNAITQGGALMLYSALGKMGSAVRLQERFDTRIAELELAYADRRQLGDGRLHAIEPGKPQVPWVPYFGGSILRSDYYIVGGITEVNYNIQSGGAELSVSAVGGKSRTFTMNVGVDLRVVDSRSLVVIKTVSMQKQITGVEVGAGIFRFFGSDLLDLNVGAKSQEPLQLGVRTTIEHGLLELLGGVSGLNPQPCVELSLSKDSAPDKWQAAVQAVVASARRSEAPTSAAAAPARAADAAVETGRADAATLSVPVNAVSASAQSGVNGSSAIAFEPNQSNLDGMAAQMLANLGTALASDKKKTLRLDLLTRETENLPSAQRRQLAQERAKAVSDALLSKGLDSSRIVVDWLPDAASPIQRQGAGMQVVARLRVVEARSGSGM